MASITVKSLIEGVQKTQLNDVEKVTWTDDVLLLALNQALSMLILVRPDVTATFDEFVCIAGTRQTIPKEATRLLKVVRNIKANGVLGRAVRLVNQHDLDSADPNWHSGTPKDTAKEYMFDDRSPRWFYVYPPVLAGVKLEIEYALFPKYAETLADTLSVDAIYQQPLQEFMLYKLLSGEGGQGQGMQHYNNALSLLGAKPSVDRFTAPITQSSPATGVGK